MQFMSIRFLFYQYIIFKCMCLEIFFPERWTPLMVARSWHRNWLEEILSTQTEALSQFLPSSYLCLPLMSIIKIAR